MQTSTLEPQVVIIGSGPAGVSAAFPLVEKGVRVLMLNAGQYDHSSVELYKSDTLRKLRQSSRFWKITIGERYEQFRDDDGSPPKHRVPSYLKTFAEFKQRYTICTENFSVYGSLERGGLSNIWGTGVSMFDDNDLQDYPISHRDLRRSYQRVTQRIGVSGANDDDLSAFHGYEESLQPPLVPHGNAQLLYRRYRTRSGLAHRRGVFLGHNRMATLTRNHQGRQGCVNCSLCAYGCASQSMWSARYDLAKLLEFPNFSYRSGAFVTHLRRLEEDYVIYMGADPHHIADEIKTQQVVLASGTIGSARLVLDALNLYDESRTLLNNPIAAFALFVPRWRISSLLDEDVLGSSQLSYYVTMSDSSERYASGHLFLADTFSTTEYLTYMPFPYPLSRQIVRRLQPTLLIGTCYLGSSYSRNTMCLSSSGDLKISGGHTSSAAPAFKAAINRLASALIRYNIYLIPGSITMDKIGVDVHYAGTVPMRDTPCIGEANSLGEVQGLPGVYVVDGSALTSLPSKLHTLTIMANADRIATAIAEARPS